MRALVVRGPHRRESIVAWERVRTFEPTGVSLGPNGRATPARDELRLARDVLDAQVVDVAGRRRPPPSPMCELTRTDGGLRVIAVDVGWRGLVRRLGAGRLARGRAQARELVDWSDLHVMSARGHGLQLRTTSSALHRLTPGAAVGSSSPPCLRSGPRRHSTRSARSAPPRPSASSARALAAASSARCRPTPPSGRSRRCRSTTPSPCCGTSIPQARRARLAAIEPARRTELERLLAHPADTAGGLMTTDVRTARAGEPLEEIVARLREQPPPLEGLFTVIVLDGDGRLAGLLPPQLADPRSRAAGRRPHGHRRHTGRPDRRAVRALRPRRGRRRRRRPPAARPRRGRRRARGGAADAAAAPSAPLPLAVPAAPCGALAGSPPSSPCSGRDCSPGSPTTTRPASRPTRSWAPSTATSCCGCWPLDVALVLFHAAGCAHGDRHRPGAGRPRARALRRPRGAMALVALVIANVGTTCAEFAGVAAALDLAGVSRYMSVPVAAVGVSLARAARRSSSASSTCCSR